MHDTVTTDLRLIAHFHSTCHVKYRPGVGTATNNFSIIFQLLLWVHVSFTFYSHSCRSTSRFAVPSGNR